MSNNNNNNNNNSSRPGFSWTGQHALQSLPSKSWSSKRQLAMYPLPKNQSQSSQSSQSTNSWTVYKVSRKGQLLARTLSISNDRSFITIMKDEKSNKNNKKKKKRFFSWKKYNNKHKNKCVIHFARTDRIQRGAHSPRFCTALSVLLQAGETDALAQLLHPVTGTALSIVTLDDDDDDEQQQEEQLLKFVDLVVPTLAAYEQVRCVLEDCLALVHQEYRQVYSATEQWVRSCYCGGNNNDHDDDIERRVVEWRHEQWYKSTRHAVFVLWQELCATDPLPPPNNNNNSSSAVLSVSTVAFLSFLRSRQRLFDYQLSDAINLVQILLPTTTTPTESLQNDHDAQQQEQQQLRLTRDQFAEYLHSDANDVLQVSNNYDDDAKNQWKHGLACYWIHAAAATASHDDAQWYTSALLRGIRAFSLPLYVSGRRGEDLEITVGKKLPFRQVLYAIRHFLQQYDPYSLPVWIRLEYHTTTMEEYEAIAALIRQQLGPALWKPAHLDLRTDRPVPLPTPDEARGRCIVWAKRPVTGKRVVVHDDYDANNVVHTVTTTTAATRDASFAAIDDPNNNNNKKDDKGQENRDPPEESTTGTVIWFDARGPIRSTDPTVKARTPDALFQAATVEAKTAVTEWRRAQKETTAKQARADAQEELAAQLTLQAGLTPQQVKERAAGRSRSTVSEDAAEGVEIHSVLPEFANADRDRYTAAQKKAADAATAVQTTRRELQQAQARYEKAQAAVTESAGHAQAFQNRAQRAAQQARTHQEHAHTAKERIEQVRQLLLDSQDKSSSAGTVVQTALTEAKISEKRAADAANRAARAQQAADKDRLLADRETAKEEEMEQSVSQLHEKCKLAADRTQRARERVEKGSRLLERTHEEIRTLENSVQYRRESLDDEKKSADQLSLPPGMAAHAVKLKERDRCRALIKEAADEHQSAERARLKVQGQFEEQANAWRVQSELAARARRSADRSLHLADELAEHAEEEREAASLRQVARERAEAAVHNRGSHQSSVEAQLQEAERAAAEAASLAVKSRNQAESLAREARGAADESAVMQVLEETKWEVRQAQGAYDSAVLFKEKSAQIAQVEKRRLDTTSELMDQANRQVARVKVEPLYENQAIDAFHKALKLREEAADASKREELASQEAATKQAIAQNARLYKEEQEMSDELPDELLQSTLIHGTRFQRWSKSLALDQHQAHSMSKEVITSMLNDSESSAPSNMVAFTGKRMCRVFNGCDPVTAWSIGCQFVEVDVDATDVSTVTADGRFRSSGSCGYVLKPKWLTTSSAATDFSEEWSLELLSGMNVGAKYMSQKSDTNTSEVVNPFVRITLSTGNVQAPVKVLHETNVVKKNGFNPVWAKETLEFSVEQPSVAMLTFMVLSQTPRGEEFLAAASVPVAHLREGYRSVALFDSHHARFGPFAYASLLVHVLKR